MTMNTPITKYSDPWYSEPGILYFLAAGTPAIAIKIGVAKRTAFAKRFKHIQTSNHEPIELLGVIAFDEGDKPMVKAEAKERQLHRQFAHLQRLVDGTVGYEWFTASPDLLEFIKTSSLPPEQLGLPRRIAKLKPVIVST